MPLSSARSSGSVTPKTSARGKKSVGGKSKATKKRSPSKDVDPKALVALAPKALTEKALALHAIEEESLEVPTTKDVMGLDAVTPSTPAAPEHDLPVAPPPSLDPATEVKVRNQLSIQGSGEVAVKLELEAMSPTSLAPAMQAQGTVALVMALNRCLAPARERVRRHDFSIDGLVGFDMQNAKVGVVGSGAAAEACATLMRAFGGHVTLVDPLAAAAETPLNALGMFMNFMAGDVHAGAPAAAGGADLLDVFSTSDIILVHADAPSAALSCLVGKDALSMIKPGAMLVTSHASLVNVRAALAAVDSTALGSFGCLGDLQAPEDMSLVLNAPNVLVAGRTNAPAPAGAAAGQGASNPPVVCVGAESSVEDVVKVAVFSSRSYFTERFAAAATAWNSDATRTLPPLRFECHAAKLSASHVGLATGCRAVCNFVNDDADGEVVRELKELGVSAILNRCAGFDKVDLTAAAAAGVRVARVPAYSPEAVAQQAVALLLSLAWKLGRGVGGERGLDFSKTTVGVLGTGRIGYLFAMVMQGFGCRVVAYDPYKNKAIEEAGIPYLDVDQVLSQADVLSLHVPLLPATTHMLNAEAIGKLKPGALVVNVSRGGLVDTAAVIDGLESGQIGGYGADVYEHEANYFFEDHSAETMEDELLARLIAQPSVLLTGHLAFLTTDALEQIVGTTMLNLKQVLEGGDLKNEVLPPPSA